MSSNVKNIKWYLLIFYAWAVVTGFLYVVGYIQAFGISILDIRIDLPFIALISFIPIDSLIRIGIWVFPGVLAGVISFVALLYLMTYLFNNVKEKALRWPIIIICFLLFFSFLLFGVRLVGNFAEHFNIISQHNNLFFGVGTVLGGLLCIPIIYEVVQRRFEKLNFTYMGQILIKYKIIYVILVIILLSFQTLNSMNKGTRNAFLFYPLFPQAYKLDSVNNNGYSGFLFSLCKLKDTEENIYYLFTNSNRSYLYNSGKKETLVKSASENFSLDCPEQEKSRDIENERTKESINKLKEYFNR